MATPTAQEAKIKSVLAQIENYVAAAIKLDQTLTNELIKGTKYDNKNLTEMENALSTARRRLVALH